MFDCGVVNNSQLISVSKETKEIEQCQFVDIDEVGSYVPEGVATRITAGLAAKSDTSKGYVERRFVKRIDEKTYTSDIFSS